MKTFSKKFLLDYKMIVLPVTVGLSELGGVGLTDTR